jgi:crossover junction endodeoxyribonuclease RuvC
MLKLGRAQGVVMVGALSRQIPIVEYSPKTVKQSVTGNGNASKEQVASMLDHLLKMKLELKCLMLLMPWYCSMSSFPWQ